MLQARGFFPSLLVYTLPPIHGKVWVLGRRLYQAQTSQLADLRFSAVNFPSGRHQPDGEGAGSCEDRRLPSNRGDLGLQLPALLVQPHLSPRRLPLGF